MFPPTIMTEALTITVTPDAIEARKEGADDPVARHSLETIQGILGWDRQKLLGVLEYSQRIRLPLPVGGSTAELAQMLQFNDNYDHHRTVLDEQEDD